VGRKARIAATLFSQSFIDAVKMERRLVACRARCFSPANLSRILRVRKATDVSLELGSSNDRALDRWVGIDLARPQSGFRWDLRWGIPLRSESVLRIHTEHFLDYVEYPYEIESLVRECHRVLKHEGLLRIVLTDASKYMLAYASGDREHFERLKDLGGASRPFETEIEVINQAFRLGGEHRFTYDFKTMERLLRRVGFREIRETRYDPERHVDRADWWRMQESFYLEAIR